MLVRPRLLLELLLLVLLGALLLTGGALLAPALVGLVPGLPAWAWVLLTLGTLLPVAVVAAAAWRERSLAPAPDPQGTEAFFQKWQQAESRAEA